MFNIEIKAKCDNLDEIEARAKQISEDGKRTVIVQVDTFFNVLHPESNNGRLKLRQYEDGSGVLIYYERPDKEGPKLSEYTKGNLDKEAFQQVYKILSTSNGILGEVRKVRHLYMLGPTRIHIDRVAGLGDFMELEVALCQEEDAAEGTKICDEVMNKLGIKKENLVSGAYFDLLMKPNNVPPA